MAKATLTPPPAFVERLKRALRQRLPDADVTAEHIRGNRYRFIVISDRFKGMKHPERQRRVWRVAESVVSGDELLDVGMILTVAPEELPED